MKCFAFVIHHKCSYRDGMLIVVANNYDHAVDILKAAQQKDVIRRYDDRPGYPDDPILNESAEILEHYPQMITSEQRYNDIWCLYHSFEMAGVEEPGIKGGAYHDG